MCQNPVVFVNNRQFCASSTSFFLRPCNFPASRLNFRFNVALFDLSFIVAVAHYFHFTLFNVCGTSSSFSFRRCEFWGRIQFFFLRPCVFYVWLIFRLYLRIFSSVAARNICLDHTNLDLYFRFVLVIWDLLISWPETHHFRSDLSLFCKLAYNIS